MITPEVSICCLTYNHSKFIKAALDGFLSQKTNFRYEIIVYDDCSTDGTQDILREYAENIQVYLDYIFQIIIIIKMIQDECLLNIYYLMLKENI